jgi:uracil-DNA glycosylase
MKHPNLVVIGQAPGRSAGLPLEGAGMMRLCRWAGVEFDYYLRRTERLNLINRYPGRSSSGGDRFPERRAAAEARKLLRMLDGLTVILLGRNVQTAFGVPDDAPPFTRWILPHTNPERPTTAWLIPHPSGISRFYNCAGNRGLAGELFRALLICHPPAAALEAPGRTGAQVAPSPLNLT